MDFKIDTMNFKIVIILILFCGGCTKTDSSEQPVQSKSIDSQTSNCKELLCIDSLKILQNEVEVSIADAFAKGKVLYQQTNLFFDNTVPDDHSNFDIIGYRGIEFNFNGNKGRFKRYTFNEKDDITLVFSDLIKLNKQTRIEQFASLFPCSLDLARGGGFQWSGLVLINNSDKQLDYSKWILFFQSGKLKVVEYYMI